MNALTPTEADIASGAFQADAAQNAIALNPFVIWTAAAMMPWQIGMAMQKQIIEQITPEMESAAFFTRKGQEMMMRRMGLGA